MAFDRTVAAIENGGLLDDLEHPNPEKYPHQRVMVVVVEGYAYTVPYVEDVDHLFLKTVFPSRSYTRTYLRDDGQRRESR